MCPGETRSTTYVSAAPEDPQYSFFYIACEGKAAGDACTACDPAGLKTVPSCVETPAVERKSQHQQKTTNSQQYEARQPSRLSNWRGLRELVRLRRNSVPRSTAALLQRGIAAGEV